MNIIPLVDVMLVLLVTFIVTAPVLTHAVKIDLPKATSQLNVTQISHIELTVRPDGTLYWDGVSVMLTDLPQRFAIESTRQPQPELHIHADRLARYEQIAQVMAAAAKGGLMRIGFVSQPTL